MNMDVIRSETLRYLGACDAQPDCELSELIDRAVSRVQSVDNKQYVCCQVECHVEPVGVRIGEYFIESQSLGAHLNGCTEVFLFAATLGSGVDRLLLRDSVLQPSLAATEQAVAAAVIEQYCDDVCARLQAELQLHSADYRLLSRFSPGYGDMPLKEQKFLLQSLDAYKRIGLSYTDSFMLTPMKSVTAVIGITTDSSRDCESGCAVCEKRHECIYVK